MQVTVGKYRTRSGKFATVFKLDDGGIGATFLAKGHIWGRVQSNGRRRGIFTTWKINGQHQAVGEHGWDLMERLPDRPKEDAGIALGGAEIGRAYLTLP